MRTRKGFTLIELMVVIVIIAILATFIVPQVMGAPARARDTARDSALNTIKNHMLSYSQDHNSLPGEEGATYCLTKDYDGDDEVLGELVEYFENKEFQSDPLNGVSIGEDCQNGYVYKKLPESEGGHPTKYVSIAVAEIESNAMASCSDLLDATSIEAVITAKNAFDPDTVDATNWCMYKTGL